MHILLIIFYSMVFGAALLARTRLDKYDAAWKYFALPLAVGSALSTLICMTDVGSKFTFTAGILQLGLYSFMTIIVMHFYGSRGKNEDKHRRGASVVRAAELNKLTKAEPSRLELGGVKIPARIETRSFLFVGSPGSGKSQGNMKFADRLARDGDTMIFSDPSSQFLQRYGKEGDAIFNPHDSRCCKWSPWADISGVEHCESMAKSIIPDGQGSAAEWNGYAQTILTSMLIRLFLRDNPTNRDLYYYTSVAPVSEIRELVQGLPAAPLCAEENERMFGSVRAILGTYLQPLALLDPDAGRKNGFSISRHIKENQGNLFFSYKQDQLASIRSLIACGLDICSRTILSLDPVKDRATGRRIWMILDEFPLLGRVQSIVTLLTNGSKHGAALVVGIQTISQLRGTYGKEGAQDIMASLGSQMILRCADAETAEYFSKTLGKREIMRTNYSSGDAGSFIGGDNSRWAQQVATEDSVLPSEIQTFQDLTGCLKLAGDYPIAAIRLGIVPDHESKIEAFQARDYSNTAFAQPVKPVAVQPVSDHAPAPEAALETDASGDFFGSFEV